MPASELPIRLQIYNAVPYRVFVMPDHRAVAAIVVTNDGMYFAMSHLVSVSAGSVILSVKGIDRTKQKDVVFRIGASTVTAVGYKVVVKDEYELNVLTEILRYIISTALVTNVSVVYAKGNREILPSLTEEEEKLLELIPEKVPKELEEAITALEMSVEEVRKAAEAREKKEEEEPEEDEEDEEIIEEL